MWAACGAQSGLTGRSDWGLEPLQGVSMLPTPKLLETRSVKHRTVYIDLSEPSVSGHLSGCSWKGINGAGTRNLASQNSALWCRKWTNEGWHGRWASRVGSVQKPWMPLNPQTKPSMFLNLIQAPKVSLSLVESQKGLTIARCALPSRKLPPSSQGGVQRKGIDLKSCLNTSLTPRSKTLSPSRGSLASPSEPHLETESATGQTLHPDLATSCEQPVISECQDDDDSPPTATINSPPLGASRSRKTLRVAVIGGGVGGLHVGARLAKEGYEVSVFEKNEEVGGRMQSVELEGGFRFDTGPSLLLLPQKYYEAFEALGESLDAHVTLQRVEPAAYRVFFGDQSSADLLYDVQAMCGQLEKFEVGAGAAYLRFLANAKEALDKGTPNFIERDFRSFFDFLDVPRLLPLLRHLAPQELLGQHWGQMGKYFKDPRLKALFTFQDLYVGLSPFNAPGAFSLLAATELIDGVWYPLGGFGGVRDALKRIALKLGATLRTGTPVQRIVVENGRVKGVELPGGKLWAADIVVANADLPYVYSDLLPGGQAAGRATKLANLEYSAGVIAFNLALSTRPDRLCHHNIFLSDQYEQSWVRPRGAASLVQQPNFYVHAPSRSDPSAAPSGCDAITVLFPVANRGEGGQPENGQQYKAFVDAARQKVLARFKEAGCGDLAPDIVSEFVYTPSNWQEMYNVKHGAAFGLAHGLTQLAYFRPDVADYNIGGLYFVGASTRPGNGVPLVLMGAKTTAARILEDAGGLIIK